MISVISHYLTNIEARLMKSNSLMYLDMPFTMRNTISGVARNLRNNTNVIAVNGGNYLQSGYGRQINGYNYNRRFRMISHKSNNMGLMYVVSRCERYLGVMEGLFRQHVLYHSQYKKSFGEHQSELFIDRFRKHIGLLTQVIKFPQRYNIPFWHELENIMIQDMYQVGALIVWTQSQLDGSSTSTGTGTGATTNNKSSHQKHHFFVPAIAFSKKIIETATFVGDGL